MWLYKCFAQLGFKSEQFLPTVNKNEIAGLVADEIVNLIDEDELTRIETAAISNYSETEQVFVTD